MVNYKCLYIAFWYSGEYHIHCTRFYSTSEYLLAPCGIKDYYTPVLERTTNTETRIGCAVFIRIQALFDVSRYALLCRRWYSHHCRPEVGRADSFNRQFSLIFAFFAYIRVFSPYFRVNSVDKSCRKAIINYLRESNTKIRENKRKSAVVVYFW